MSGRVFAAAYAGFVAGVCASAAALWLYARRLGLMPGRSSG